MARQLADQAAGLRKLFTPGAVRVVALVGVESQSVAAALALSLTQQSKTVLLVDEQLCAKIPHPLIKKKPRLDIGHVLQGKADLKDVFLSGLSDVVLMPANTELALNYTEAAKLQLLDSFHALASKFDFVIIHAASDIRRHGVGFSLAASEVIVVCDEHDQGITAAYRQIKMLAQMQGERHYMLMIRGGNEHIAKGLFHKLSMVCWKYLRLKPDFACVLPANPFSAACVVGMYAIDMMHWPLSDDGKQFDIFMCRLLSAIGSNLAAV